MDLCEESEEEEDVPGPSCVSLRSDTSIQNSINFCDKTETNPRKKKRTASPEPSLAMKSETSLQNSINFCDKPGTINPSAMKIKKASPESSCGPTKRESSIKDDFKKTVTINLRDNQIGPPQHDSSNQQANNERIKKRHKISMKTKYEKLFEGVNVQENQTLLNRIYTQLYILEGEREGVNEEHEVVKMEKTARIKPSRDTPIYCNDIFRASAEAGREEKEQIKTVLTKGIAGIGKTVSVQKFILDWAEGKANQDVDFMFVLPFRELNLIKDQQYSLHRLLLDFHPELQDLDSKIYEESKVVFIFDGLDESRITLRFTDDQKVCDVTESSSVGVLISKLMKGDLLPSALIWITSRPAAANQIPSRYINRLTEIQGFNDSQKEEYFKKKISDEHQFSRIISHIRRSRSLHIMCHIPVFCWISSTVLQNLLKQNQNAEIPQTLTEMYIHFLKIQINMRNQKYEERKPEELLQSNRELIVKLAELAFKQLMKGNVMFYEEDLRECGIDFTEASVYSGICTEIFKEESVIHQRKVYCFIHRSFQEFLAAFSVFYSHLMKKTELLQFFLEDKYESYSSKDNSLCELLKSAVTKTLQSKNGYLDLFSRFLLGISLESNQRLLQDLLTHTEKSSEVILETTQHIKDKIKESYGLQADRSISLFLCLLEVNDQTLYREIQGFVNSDEQMENRLSPGQCSAIAYILQMGEEILDEFDLKKYNTSDVGRKRLIPAVINCRRALLADCRLTGDCCESLSSVLQSSNCVLKELDMSNNDLQDSGVTLLFTALKSSPCQLTTLRMAGCRLTGDCCESLSSVLQSPNCVLRELDLSNNDLQDSGVKMLFIALKTSPCQLTTLRLVMCNLTGDCCDSLSAILKSNSFLRELDLSNNDLGDSGVKRLSTGLGTADCQLNTLRLSGCMVTEEGCRHLSSALSSNPSHLRELDLSYNHPGDSGVKLLSENVDRLNVDHGGEIRIKAGLHKYAFDVTLDPNTAHARLILSEENRKVTFVEEKQSYPDHPDRFDGCPQVLSEASLSGRCYWEVEWRGNTIIAVTYEGIRRKGGSCTCEFGYNKNSWSLICFNKTFAVWHNLISAYIRVPSDSFKRIAVYVDVSAGILSFYSVSDTHILTHLHTFNNTFTETMHAAFTVYDSVALF